MQKSDKIFVAGHRGMVGSAIVRKLIKDGFTNIVTKTSSELDLKNQSSVSTFFADEQPDYVFLAAAKVGGIVANNTFRAEFIYENLMIEANVIHSAYKSKVKKLMFLGSSCIYPKLAPQPLKEEYILTGPLEYTNQPYAIAKIAGIEMCNAYRNQYGCNFVSVMPTNLYGPNDNYDPNNSHVLPGLLRRFMIATRENIDSVQIWGDGSPKREFLFVDDLAESCVFLMDVYNEEGLINIGFGEDISILELAIMIKEIVGFKGKIEFDTSKPNGTPRKLMDVSKIHQLGWRASIDLRTGIEHVYNELITNPIF